MLACTSTELEGEGRVAMFTILHIGQPGLLGKSMVSYRLLSPLSSLLLLLL